jgi:hypothetical protein
VRTDPEQEIGIAINAGAFLLNLFFKRSATGAGVAGRRGLHDFTRFFRFRFSRRNARNDFWLSPLGLKPARARSYRMPFAVAAFT